MRRIYFVDEPFYNEPGEEYMMHTAEGKQFSADYNSNVRNATIKFAMMEQIEKAPVGFEYVTLTHFYLNKDRIIRQIKEWTTDGVSKDSHLNELTSVVDTLTKQLLELQKPEPPKEDDDDDDDDDDE